MHFYRVGNDYFPSVTTIIHTVIPESENISEWKRRNGNWKRRLSAAQSLGTLVHFRILNQLSSYDLELPMIDIGELPDDALMRAEIADHMWGGLKFDVGYPRQVETFVVNNEYRYAGKPDLVAPINGVMTLVDLKTSKNIYESHKLQIGGYYEALNRMPDQGMLVSLNSDEYSNPNLSPHYVVMDRKEMDEYAERFLQLAVQFYELGYEKTYFKDEYKVEGTQHINDL